jgi:hypothetical protein
MCCHDGSFLPAPETPRPLDISSLGGMSDLFSLDTLIDIG